MQKKVKSIISYRNLDVRVTGKPDRDILNLLDNTVLGSAGGLRHQLTNIDKRIKAYGNNIRFVSLYLKDRLAGTVGLCYRTSLSAAKEHHSSYIRYLSFMPMFRTALKRKEPATKTSKQSWKEEVFAFFRKPHLLGFPGYKEGDKHVVYAYIESHNERSRNLIEQVGLENIRSFITVPFSRFNPGESERVSKLPIKDRDRMKNILEGFYVSHSFFTSEFSFYDDKYYIIKEGEDIVAGLAAIPNAFRIVDIPGFKGWLFMNILHRLPLLRKLFNPREIRFLAIESIYCKEGREKELEEIIESACALEGYNLAITWLDDKSGLYHRIIKKTSRGIVEKMLDPTPAQLYAGFVNYTDEERKAFKDRPAFIPGFDFT
ncbi:MAG TPA: hypothetical protein VJ877_07465 [Bacteroidales bacterium]|nr:hypothetical protein [Bacteroidales bacterium]